MLSTADCGMNIASRKKDSVSSLGITLCAFALAGADEKAKLDSRIPWRSSHLFTLFGRSLCRTWLIPREIVTNHGNVTPFVVGFLRGRGLLLLVAG